MEVDQYKKWVADEGMSCRWGVSRVGQVTAGLMNSLRMAGLGELEEQRLEIETESDAESWGSESEAAQKDWGEVVVLELYGTDE